MRTFLAVAALFIIGLANAVSAATEAEKAEAAKKAAMKQAAIVGAALGTIANQLSLAPEAAKDFTKVSGEYCYFGGWDGHHVHYAVDPTKTEEDVIAFVKVDSSLLPGVNVEALPKFPGKLGSMTPKQWYLLPAGELEPHHGTKLTFPLMIRAVNVE